MLVVRVAAMSALASAAAANDTSRNVLYIVYDDLRPDLSPYGQSHMKTPNLQKLADTGITFERAYCQTAVCAPSRNSFSTGRRPSGTRAWNFLNHFRQASCEQTNHWKVAGVPMAGGFTQGGGWNPTKKGGAGQCCTTCTGTKGCAGWLFTSDVQGGNCTLFSSVTGGAPCAVDETEAFESCVSGGAGAYEQWTPLPANFRRHGYLTLGAGKYYHDGCGGLGGAPDDAEHPGGDGSPPMADRQLSWSDVPVQWPNQSEYVARWGQIPFAYGNFQYLVPDDEGCPSAGPPSIESSDYCTVSRDPAPGAL